MSSIWPLLIKVGPRQRAALFSRRRETHGLCCMHQALPFDLQQETINVWQPKKRRSIRWGLIYSPNWVQNLRNARIDLESLGIHSHAHSTLVGFMVIQRYGCSPRENKSHYESSGNPLRTVRFAGIFIQDLTNIFFFESIKNVFSKSRIKGSWQVYGHNISMHTSRADASSFFVPLQIQANWILFL